jgi:alpha-glucoside transport system permease protein
MSADRIKKILSGIPTHALLIGLCLVWLIPTIGLLVTSFRPFQEVTETGWWTVLSPPKGAKEYAQSCASCHGTDGKAIATADLTDSELVKKYPRSIKLLAMLKKDVEGQPHLKDAPAPDQKQAAAIASYLKRLSGIESSSRFTINNYLDALVGYRGTTNYVTDCEAGTQPVDLNCNASDLGNPRGIARGFVNALLVAIPASILPILFALFAAYALSWLHFRGRMWMFALLVGLQIVPLQMTLVPISRLYTDLAPLVGREGGLNGTFLGVWLFHTGFGLPYAIYLIRNFLGALPRDLFESAYLDGASHWTAFWRLALPLSMPALASLGIFQFLWVWNDLLVALVFLGGQTPVMTYQISNLVTSLGGGWHLLTAAAFLSMLLPMLVFFGLQRYFVRGLLAGSVKG